MVDQAPEEALDSVGNAVQTTIIAAIFALLGAGLLSIILAPGLVQPLRRLTTVTERVAAGDLSQRAALTRRDEIGRLAQSFDAMAEALEQRVNAEQAARAEADRLQQAETRSRWRGAISHNAWRSPTTMPWASSARG
jgi:nitrogen fixation/metabolism regulation signal transduction histidine kinase